MIVRKVRAVVAVVVVTVAAVVVSPAPASASVDVYGTPGQHHVNGRDWMTWCENYSDPIIRCWTEIKSGGRYVFNNLTYVGGLEADWRANPLANNGRFTSAGRQWRTECNTANTGRGGCRSYIQSSNSGWVFNNQVRFWRVSNPNLVWRPPAGSGSATWKTAPSKPDPKPVSTVPVSTGKTWTIRLRSNAQHTQAGINNCALTPTRWLGHQHVAAHNYCNAWEANKWHGIRPGDKVVVRNTAGSVVMQGLVERDFDIAYHATTSHSDYPWNGSSFFWVQVSYDRAVKKDTNHIFVVRKH